MEETAQRYSKPAFSFQYEKGFEPPPPVNFVRTFLIPYKEYACEK